VAESAPEKRKCSSEDEHFSPRSTGVMYWENQTSTVSQPNKTCMCLECYCLRGVKSSEIDPRRKLLINRDLLLIAELRYGTIVVLELLPQNDKLFISKGLFASEIE
jgi:hypothetical protein